jgi:hypothetical protein
LKVYKHIEAFNVVDLDETMEMEEKFKARQKHEAIMKKLDARPVGYKEAQFRKYQTINEKSHMYNQQVKTDKMFRELNSVNQRPNLRSMISVQDPSLSLYAPIIELKRDEAISSTMYPMPSITDQHSLDQGYLMSPTGGVTRDTIVEQKPD